MSKILKDKPVMSNQHGALVMAFVPFLYGIFASHITLSHLWLGLSWLFIYFFSYPFMALFNRKNTQKYKKWAIIYAIISVILAIPLLYSNFAILQFAIPILPLVLIEIYYAKKKDERNLINDIAGILTFGIVGMASFYLSTGQYNVEVLIHPTLFFIAGTFYVKSIARERKNPLYLKLSIGSHILFGIGYLLLGYIPIAITYVFALLRAIIVPQLDWNIKKVGLSEFAIVLIFVIGLYFSV